jgi:hypothetical protein
MITPENPLNEMNLDERSISALISFRVSAGLLLFLSIKYFVVQSLGIKPVYARKIIVICPFLDKMIFRTDERAGVKSRLAVSFLTSLKDARRRNSKIYKWKSPF